MKTGLCDIPSAPHLKCVMCVGGDIIKILFSLFGCILKWLFKEKKLELTIIQAHNSTINIHKD